MSVSFGFILNKAEVWLIKHLIFMSSNIFPLLVEYSLLKNTIHWPVSNKWIVRWSFHLKNNYSQTSLTQTRSFPVSFVREVCVYKQLKLQKLQIILLWPEAKFLLNWYHNKNEIAILKPGDHVKHLEKSSKRLKWFIKYNLKIPLKTQLLPLR